MFRAVMISCRPVIDSFQNTCSYKMIFLAISIFSSNLIFRLVPPLVPDTMVSLQTGNIVLLGGLLVLDPQICMTKWQFMRLGIACLPSWFRFAQCLRRYRDTKERFPHLANAAKYATSFFVLTFSHLYLATNKKYVISENPYFYLWIFASIISTCYSYTWDIKMDWGLFDNKAGDNKFLREEVVYSYNAYYYFAIVEDLVLRFGWVLSMSLTEMGYIHAELMVAILSPLEVFRRFVWNFFRLENEHLNNCGKFRAVRDISVAPMDSSDQGHILRMMDMEDGVTNRHRKKPKKRDTRLLLDPEESTDDPDAS